MVFQKFYFGLWLFFAWPAPLTRHQRCLPATHAFYPATHVVYPRSALFTRDPRCIIRHSKDFTLKFWNRFKTFDLQGCRKITRSEKIIYFFAVNDPGINLVLAWNQAVPFGEINLTLSRVWNTLRKSSASVRDTVPTYRHLTVVKSYKQICRTEKACKSDLLM